jgi:Ca2+-transporting ATPase
MAGIIHGQPAYEMFLSGVSLAVAAIPEGLPAIVTVALALGVQRMIRRKAIVRKLPSVETLGSATVICSDKTGTLTENKMAVVGSWLDQQLHIQDNATPSMTTPSPCLAKLQLIARACNNAQGSGAEYSGDATEIALLKWSPEIDNTIKRIAEIPFDSERKMMSVIIDDTKTNERQLLCKGAPEIILQQSTHILLGGQISPITSALQTKVQQASEKMASGALRVLGFAYRQCSPGTTNCEEKQLIFVGLLGLIDPPREEVKDSINTCKAAGIRTVMITGDHRITAEAIARQIGIWEQGLQTLTGSDLETLNERQLEDVVDRTVVYARVAPEHKMRIVRALQKRGHIVAMTGDGVNDAPAIKAADIGIAMGQNGTDVAKEASALVLANDNFATIVAAVEEGRNIYDNIRKFIRYLLASNVGEMMTMMLAMLMGLPLPMVPIQILWVNLVTDGLPAMALGVDQAEEDLMTRSPRTPRENIFARRLGWKIISRGLAIGVCTLLAFFITYKTDPHLGHAQTVAFATLVMAQLIHVFDCRSSRSIFHRNMFENKALVVAVLSSILLLLAVIYIAPLQPLFHTVDLSLRDWALVLVMAAAPTLLFGIGSIFSNKSQTKKMRMVQGTVLLRR